ncbi:MAG TPA: CHAP domain-containing protein, partial [Cytophagales bacterium]|nr:CHAP domain-containing protein [Cytophagales bacterium]
MNRKWMLLSLIAMVLVGIWLFYKYNFNIAYRVGQPIDSLNGVVVYYNGAVGHVSGRNLTKDKYNLGQKYQCVEFVKRYYYEYYKHKMPDSYGHAKDFFDASVSDGALNTKRDLIQYTNPSMSMPKQGDLLVYSGTVANRFGHVAIVAKVHKDGIEIIQQNPGMYGSSRGVYG